MYYMTTCTCKCVYVYVCICIYVCLYYVIVWPHLLSRVGWVVLAILIPVTI